MNFKIVANLHLISTSPAQNKSELCQGEIRFFVSWYTLPRARNLKPIFEFQTPLAQKSSADTSELIPFGANSDLRRKCTLSRNCPAGTSEFTSFWRQLGSPLGMKIPGDSFSGVPLCFRWRFQTNSFWPKLGSSLEFSRWHLEIHSV